MKAHAHVHAGLLGEKSELAFALMSGALLAIGWVTAWKALGPVWLPTAFYAAAYAFGGFFTLRRRWRTCGPAGSRLTH